MDPPTFAGGKDSWKLEEDFVYLISQCKKLLSENPLFFIVNGYASEYSALTYANNIEDLVTAHNGSITFGELTLEQNDKRLLPAGIYARWEK
jgi:23S rRNA (cytosine1962-C5)-methyltransferase